jgi:hypothetical protein
MALKNPFKPIIAIAKGLNTVIKVTQMILKYARYIGVVVDTIQYAKGRLAELHPEIEELQSKPEKK